ncbi:MAG: hypothetical protein JO322_13730 [Candidatus Eremiobacteraeota bacterium]|nr:hypothetical protein [Candidatus Eremiobacteraeota bacterium]
MRRALPVSTIALISAFAAAPGSADVLCDITIPATMVDTIGSAHAYPGERFRFKTTAASKFGDVDIPEGAEGMGVVRYVQGAKSRNRGGLLILEPRFISIGESRIAVMSDPRETAEWAHMATLTDEGISMIPIGMLQTAIHYLRPGTNVILGPGFKFHVVVMEDLISREPCRPATHSTERRQSSPEPSPSPEI